MKKFLIKTDEHLRARIIMIIWKQWKKPKTQIKNLVKCVYSIDEARGLAYCRKGYMFIAHSKILQNAILTITIIYIIIVNRKIVRG